MELPQLTSLLRGLWGETDLDVSPLLVAKIAADEALCALRRVRFGATPSGEWQRIVDELLMAADVFAARGWIESPAAYHDTPPPLLHPEVRRARSFGLDFQHLQFPSEYTPHRGEPGRYRWQRYRANHTAHAWVLRHRGRPRRWIMCLHGYGMGAPAIDLAGFRVPWLYHELGLNVIIPVLPLHGPRKIGWASGDGFFTGDCLDTVHAEAQAIWDLRRLLSWVRAQDAPAVGVYGLSLGGYTAALLGAFDRDLACIIAGIPPSDFVGLARHHIPQTLLRGAERIGFDWEKATQVFRVVSPLALKPLLPRERRFLFAGLADRIVPPAQSRELWAHWEQPRMLWYSGSHLSFHWEPEVRALLGEALEATLCQKKTSVARRPFVRHAA